MLTPRPPCAAHGKSSDAKSPSAPSTREPSGAAAATSPTSSETVAPIATASALTPCSRSRARSVLSPQRSQLVRPPRQSSSALLNSVHAVSGGSPKLAVSRYGATGCHWDKSSGAVARRAASRLWPPFAPGRRSRPPRAADGAGATLRGPADRDAAPPEEREDPHGPGRRSLPRGEAGRHTFGLDEASDVRGDERGLHAHRSVGLTGGSLRIKTRKMRKKADRRGWLKVSPQPRRAQGPRLF